MSYPDDTKVSGAILAQSPLTCNANQHYAPSDASSHVYTSSPAPAPALVPATDGGHPHSNALRPFHHLAHKLGAESPLPQPLDIEILKAKRILEAFTSDPSVPLSPLPRAYPTQHGHTSRHSSQRNLSAQPPTSDTRKNHTLLPIPPSILSSCVGLAIFSSVRLSFHATFSTGSGILIRRLPDGSWSPPSAIGVHAVGAGFSIGGDVSEIVLVINSQDAMDAFTRTKVTLGGDVAISAGPYGLGGGVGVVVEGMKNHSPATKAPSSPFAVHIATAPSPSNHFTDEKADLAAYERPATSLVVDEKLSKAERKEQEKARKRESRAARRANAELAVRTAFTRPVYTYARSRGLYAGLQLAIGTVVTERCDANEKFYGVKGISTSDILAGRVEQGNLAQVEGLYELLGRVEAGWQRHRSVSRVASIPIGMDKTSSVTEIRDLDIEMAASGVPEIRVHRSVTVTTKGTHQDRQRDEEWEELPKYEEDGVNRPGVGDVKHPDEH